jgi:cephalosporin hydroxylase
MRSRTSYLLLGLLLACVDDPPPRTLGDAAPAAEVEPEPAPRKQSKQRRGHRYGGSEVERVRSRSELDAIDKMTLKLRSKQPIYFLGLPMRQIPTDNWLVSELIYELEPDYIVEAGTLYGGSAVYYASLLEFVNPDAKVLTIDINKAQIHAEATSHPLWAKRVKFFEGSSTSPEIHEQLAAEIGEGKQVFVTLDTLHAPNHVRDELNLFSDLVSPGSYMILQDTYYEGLPEVIDEFLKSHPDWEQVEAHDKRFVFTKYRGGFLRKKAS